MSDVNRENNKRIAKNTLLLYFRMIFTMSVSLFTSRVILATLGIEDYGVNNVVAGFVTMFSFFSGSLGAAISRFLTYELGSGSTEKLKKIFFYMRECAIVGVVFCGDICGDYWSMVFKYSVECA